LAPDKGIYVEWSVNEKAALEVAAGCAYAGVRCLVAMKQVGLNVACDPLMTMAYIGVKGGLVLVVADDPGPHSSQNEQDTRQFVRLAKLPVLDPCSPAEAGEMVRFAFDLSESLQLPVILRPTTRVSHVCQDVAVNEATVAPGPAGHFVKSPEWVIFPALVQKKHPWLNERQKIARS
jgi:indolepyruvate ferredoxin oxidoreductase alpha subunit